MPTQPMSRLAVREDGQTLVEYVLILGFVAVLLVGALAALQGGLEPLFNDVAGAL